VEYLYVRELVGVFEASGLPTAHEWSAELSASLSAVVKLRDESCIRQSRWLSAMMPGESRAVPEQHWTSGRALAEMVRSRDSDRGGSATGNGAFLSLHKLSRHCRAPRWMLSPSLDVNGAFRALRPGLR